VRKTWWSRPTSWAEVKRRAAGRYKYNAIRRVQAQLRRREVLKLLGEIGWTYGSQVRIARQLGVSEATISRDLAVILPLVEECPTCHQFRPRTWWVES
jgi:DNA invertase Pin-like site-specific DNA recombinase